MHELAFSLDSGDESELDIDEPLVMQSNRYGDLSRGSASDSGLHRVSGNSSLDRSLWGSYPDLLNSSNSIAQNLTGQTPASGRLLLER